MAPTYIVFTAGVTIGWALCWRHAWRLGWFHILLLPALTLYCLGSEFLAIARAAYYYGDWALMVCQPGHAAASVTGCGVTSHCIAVPVIIMEGMIFFSLFRLAERRGLSAVGQALFVGLTAVNVDLVLDPVASQALWCGDGPGVDHPGLGFWTWLLGTGRDGLYYGVTLTNYAAWFLCPVAFLLPARWLGIRPTTHGSDSPRGPGRSAVDIALLMIAGLLLQVVFNLVFIKTFELGESPVWRWSLLVILLGGGLAGLVALRPGRRDDGASPRPIPWDLLASLLFLHGFSLGAYVLIPSARPAPSWLAIWLLGTAVTVAIGVVPAIRRS